MSSVGQARTSLTPGEVSTAGAASGAVTRLVCQPLDVAKIRLQLQVELGQARKYKNLIELMLKLPREEGVAALWKAPTRPRPRPVVEYFLRICQFCRV